MSVRGSQSDWHWVNAAIGVQKCENIWLSNDIYSAKLPTQHRVLSIALHSLYIHAMTKHGVALDVWLSIHWKLINRRALAVETFNCPRWCNYSEGFARTFQKCHMYCHNASKQWMPLWKLLLRQVALIPPYIPWPEVSSRPRDRESIPGDLSHDLEQWSSPGE